jgi:hypothetical protein
VRRHTLAVLALLLAVTTSACREDFFDPTPGATGPEQQRVELVARGVQILEGDDNAVRIGFGAKDPGAHVRVERSEDSGRIVACPLTSVDAPLPSDRATCLPDLPNGVRESISTAGLGGIALIRHGTPVSLEIRIEYQEAHRRTAMRLPVIARPAGASVCRDNGCNPVFELLPARGGRFAATARWIDGSARLEVQEGRVLARSFSSTGIPYRIAGQESGPPPITVVATLSSPTEFALAVLNTGTTALSGIEIDATWP